jgi:hypothetical protein
VIAHISLRDLRAMPGAPGLEDAWIRSVTGDDGYLTGKDAETAACDSLIVPAVTATMDATVIDAMIGLVLGAFGHNPDRDAHRDQAERLAAAAASPAPASAATAGEVSPGPPPPAARPGRTRCPPKPGTRSAAPSPASPSTSSPAPPGSPPPCAGGCLSTPGPPRPSPRHRLALIGVLHL